MRARRIIDGCGFKYYSNITASGEESLALSIFRLKEWDLLKNYDYITTVTWTHSWSGKENSVGMHVYAGERDEPYIALFYTQTGDEHLKKRFRKRKCLIFQGDFGKIISVIQRKVCF